MFSGCKRARLLRAAIGAAPIARFAGRDARLWDMPARPPFPAFSATSESKAPGCCVIAPPSANAGFAAPNPALIDLVRALARQAAGEAWAGAGMSHQPQETIP